VTTIAVIGSGNVGGTLALAWGKAGHHVPATTRATMLESVAPADVVVFAVPGAAMPEVLAKLGDALADKVVIDASNNVQRTPPSSVDLIIAAAPGARVFRAFNSVGWENMTNPYFGGEQADMLYCGNDDHGAAQLVEQLIADVGFRPIRVGGLEELPTVDGLLQLWFALAVRGGRGRRLAFKVLTD
jgi:predicted dinucleotide-binding enzyme